MSVREIRKVRFSTAIIASIVVAAIAMFIGYQTGQGKSPQNCAELGVAYLEIGKKELGITDFGSEEWNKLVQDETRFTNDCYESLK